MRTFLVIIAGFALLAVCVFIGKRVRTVRHGTRFFIALWFVLAFVNMWLGTRAGYSWAAEAPIFLLIFGVPTLAAVFLERS